MRKLLWIGDAGCESGFAKCTHNTLEALRKTWDVRVLGLNYLGEPHDWPYPIHRANLGGDAFGVKRTKGMIEKYKPDLVIIQNDPWNFPAYMKEIESLAVPPPVIGAVAVDGLNCRGRALNKLFHAIFWTDFAEDEAVKGGMIVPSSVVPLGVDINVFKPGDRDEARLGLGLPKDVRDGYIVLNVNRNQPRKRMDLTIRYFAKWVQRYKRDDAFLYLHVAPTGDQGYHVDQMGEYYGINTPSNMKLIVAEPEMYHGTPEAWVAKTMQAADVGFSTSQGEGWGLPAQEMMACGVANVLPAHSAYLDWAKDAALLVPCSSTAATPSANVVGQIMDEEAAIEALELMYSNRAERQRYADLGWALAQEDRYRWSNIAARFAEEVDRAYGRYAHHA